MIVHPLDGRGAHPVLGGIGGRGAHPVLGGIDGRGAHPILGGIVACGREGGSRLQVVCLRVFVLWCSPKIENKWPE